ncbi:MAG: pilus assembly protein PilM [Myxococcota bacterium]|nr:pilus assembly protein PilM [Myxococcota bacterium]
MANVVGVDLGSHSIKLAVLEGGFGRYELSDYQTVPVPQDGSSVPSLDERLQVLDELLSDMNADTHTIFASHFPTEMASVRVITLPFADRAQVEKTLPFEVENQTPFDLDAMLMAHRILKLEAGSSQVLVALAERTAISERLTMMGSHGADPRHLILDSEALGGLADGGTQVLIDMGHERTLLTLCHQGTTLAVRGLSHGGRDLTLALMEQGLGWTDAERVKHQVVLGPEGESVAVEAQWSEDAATPTGTPATPREASRILARALAPLLTDLRATLIGLEDHHGLEIEEILLSGGASRLKGLVELLREDLGVPIRPTPVTNRAQDLGLSAELALCHALAQKGGSQTAGEEMDFRKGEFAFRGDLSTIRTLSTYGAIALACFMLVGMGVFIWQSHQISRQIDDLEQQIGTTVLEAFPDQFTDEQVSDPTMALALMQEEATATSTRVEALGAILRDAPPVLGLIKSISEAVPPHACPQGAPNCVSARIDVQELLVTETALTIKAETDGYEEAANIEAGLKTNPRFSEARKGDETKSRDGIRFTITIPLEVDKTPGEEG